MGPVAAPGPSDDDVRRTLAESTRLCESSKRLYAHRLAQFASVYRGESIWAGVLRGVPEFERRAAGFGLTPLVIDGIVHTVKVTVWRDHALRASHPALFADWRAGASRLAKARHARYSTSAPADPSTFWPLAKIEALRDSLPEESHATKLLLGMYTLVPPRRLDYWCAHVWRRSPSAHALESGNHVIVTTRSPRIVVNEYKTAAIYGTWTYPIPPELLRIIHRSLDACPRQFLFVDTHGRKFESANAFGKHVDRLLCAATGGVRLTVNSLRHAYVTGKRSESMPNAEQDELARNMGHSWVMQQRVYNYRGICVPK